jgi:hypothetical protein
MPLPFPTNNTCDIYRTGVLPPAAPALAGVVCYLVADFERRLESGEGDASGIHFTHVMFVDRAIDVRDNRASAFTPGMPDTVWIPKVYLHRYLPTWPSNNV